MDAWLEDDTIEELQYGGNVIKKIREMEECFAAVNYCS